MENSQKVIGDLEALGLQENERAFREGRGSLKGEVFAILEEYPPNTILNEIRKKVQLL